MLDILKEEQKVELYLDNDTTGETYTNGFIKVAKLYHYCIQNGLATDWDLAALKGGKDKIGKLLKTLKIGPEKEAEIWNSQIDVFDQRNAYSEFEDLNEFLVR